jgi:hypothetical protein
MSSLLYWVKLLLGGSFLLSIKDYTSRFNLSVWLKSATLLLYKV